MDEEQKDKVLYFDEDKKRVERSTMTPVSDLAINNKLLSKLVNILWIFAGLFAALISIFLWLIFYVIKNNVLNNIVARCVC